MSTLHFLALGASALVEDWWFECSCECLCNCIRLCVFMRSLGVRHG